MEKSIHRDSGSSWKKTKKNFFPLYRHQHQQISVTRFDVMQPEELMEKWLRSGSFLVVGGSFHLKTF